MPFPGFTVVADVFGPNSDLFQRIVSRLEACTLITEHYSLLPVESYHITSFSLVEQRKMNDRQFNDWIKHHLKGMQLVHQQLHSQTAPFKFRITGVGRRRPSLICEVDDEASSQQRAVAEMSPYEKNIPRQFHISLCYQYKDSSDPNFQSLVYEQMCAIMEEELPGYSSVSLSAEQPKLCYFHDMTRFIPFDAARNPFAQVKPSEVAEDSADDLEETKSKAAGEEGKEDWLVFG